MIVCQCRGISDKTIKRAILEGASSVGQVSFACGAGADCGACHLTIEKLLEEGATNTKPSGNTDGFHESVFDAPFDH